jgi:hypothetical protein
MGTKCYVRKDLEEAERWFRAGAEAGNWQCQGETGRALELVLDANDGTHLL